MGITTLLNLGLVRLLNLDVTVRNKNKKNMHVNHSDSSLCCDNAICKWCESCCVINM